VRVFQDFATLDLLSGGRAEIMAGRGSFIESFPLFGYHLDDYNELFEEKLDLLLALRQDEHITWSGNHRAALSHQGVYPRPLQDPLPVWIAVGGTPQSVVRAATRGLPLALAIIGGSPRQFVPLVDLYRETVRRSGYKRLPISINSHGFIAETTREATDIAFPAFKATMDRIGRERGWPPLTRAQFEASIGPHGANFVGSPQDIIDKILYQHELFGHNRFLLHMTVGTLPHEQVMRSIELFGTTVAPAVRRAVASHTRKGEGAIDTAETPME
jgi:alkanesulfonate monooxygenase SsuD/methylene tetrahydromethanopterin reductase-like flavin-dependent oxidoreductase (luciferase family)